MKNLFNYLLLSSLLFISCSRNEEFDEPEKTTETKTTNRLQPGQNVKLIKVTDQNYLNCSRTGCGNIHEREYIVEVANLAFTKKVQIRQQLSNGQWEDYDLSYHSSTSNGNEIWKGKSVKSFSSPDQNAKYYGSELAVKYTVNNITYWDNNNNSNYYISYTNRPIGTKTMILANSLNILNQVEINSLYAQNDKSYFNVSVELRNIAFAKEAKVIYTTNNWSTCNTLSLSYVNYSAYLNNEFENWRGGFEIPQTQKVTYYFSYKVNGITYYDNNFGKNYILNSSN